VQKRVNTTEVKHYGEIYDFLKSGVLLTDARPKGYDRPWRSAQSASWQSLEES
jgi:hypothetical protein